MPRLYRISVSLLALTAILAAALGPAASLAQTGRLHTLDETIYDYVERLQQRGHLLRLNPTAAPYTDRALARALDEVSGEALTELEASWVERIRRRLDLRADSDRSAERPRRPSRNEALAVGITAGGGGNASRGRRLSSLRPLGAELHLYPFAELGGFVAGDRWAAASTVRHDLYYDRDPDGVDAVKRFMLRSDRTYLGYDGDWVSAYLGRYGRHWGPLGDRSTFLSTNPRTFDHLQLRLGNETLSVRGLLGELDSMNEDGTFTGRAAADSEEGDGVRRFLTGHRWDWRPNRSFLLSLMETAVYSGSSASPSLKWANPLQPFFILVDNTPKNDENNGLVGAMVWYRAAPLTYHGQVMVDDIDLKGVAGEPASVATTHSLTWAGVTDRLDLSASASMVAARTYNAPQPEGRYTYLNRGLAFPFNDFVRAGLSADWYGGDRLRDLWISPRLELLWQGEQHYERPYPPNRGGAPTVLAGEAYTRVHVGLGLRYQPSPYLLLNAEPALNYTADADHVAGRTALEAAGTVHVRIRLPWRSELAPWAN